MALLMVALVGSAVLGVLAAGRGRDRDRPPAISAAKQGPFRGNPLPEGIYGKRAPDFRLRDVSGGRLSSWELRGKPYALTFLYVHCPDVCPLIGDELRRALELLGRRARDVNVVAVSVDPEGDTSAAVRAWLRRHRLPDNFHYLIGSRRELRPLWKGYYAAPQIPGRPESSHSASIWLIDRSGRWRTKFSAGIPVPPRDVAHDLGVLLREDRPAATAR